MFSVPRVLICVCDAGQKASLQQSLAPYAELSWACDLGEMARRLEQERFDAVFCARVLCSDTWIEIMRLVQQSCPELPIIILSQTADEQEWLEVLAAGAFDLLGLPCHERTILSVMEHAVATGEARAWHAACSLPAA
ncbi:MAG: response regulator [Acidobacteria bacterium]|nr:response regulator [Acidobacteriota bacterium]